MLFFQKDTLRVHEEGSGIPRQRQNRRDLTERFDLHTVILAEKADLCRAQGIEPVHVVRGQARLGAPPPGFK